MELAVRQGGAIPATVAVLDGRLCVGESVRVICFLYVFLLNVGFYYQIITLHLRA